MKKKESWALSDVRRPQSSFPSCFNLFHFYPTWCSRARKKKTKATRREIFCALFFVLRFFFRVRIPSRKALVPCYLEHNVWGVWCFSKSDDGFCSAFTVKISALRRAHFFFVQHDNRAKNCIEQRSLTHFFLFVSSPGLECDDDVSRNYLTRARQ